MSVFQLEYRNGIYLPQLRLWLDPHEPKTGEETVFVSHAHSDHIAPHKRVVLSEPTSKLMQERMPGTREEIVLPFDQEHAFNDGPMPYTITLVPAGHILGSAMAWVRAGDESLLYTGDFKLRPGLSAEPCAPRPADHLVMETTFGRPQYVFPPTAEVLAGIVRFCREALHEEKTAVLFGYSLGKSQEILCALSEAGLPVVLHGSIYKLTRVYQQFMKNFPPCQPYEAGTARGKVLLCPPAVVNSAMLRNLGPVRTAILTGWAVDPNCRYRYQSDAAFPLSDHADFPDLVEFVRRVQPRQVFTLHGFAAEFAQTLRDLGFAARALSQQEQFTLNLVSNAEAPRAVQDAHAIEPATPVSKSEQEISPGLRFQRFAETCAVVASEPRKLEKIRLVSDYLRTLAPDALPSAVTWFTGRPFGASQNKVLQLGWAVLRDALRQAGRVNTHELHQVYLKHSDFGETAFEILSARQEGPGVGLNEVSRVFERLHAARGPLGKTPVLAATLSRCTALEAKFLVKIITGDLRIGLKEGLVEEAVAKAFDESADGVRQVNLLLGDLGETASLAQAGRLNEASLKPFRPIKLMLASPEQTAHDVWERMHPGTPPTAEGQTQQSFRDNHPVWIEDKYDGIRCQLHKAGSRVELYSRDLKEITRTFPDIADPLRAATEDFVLDGEIVAMRDQTALPFAELQRRLGRREMDLFMREEIPVRFVGFDLLWRNGVSMLNEPLGHRRAGLEELAVRIPSITAARVDRVTSPEEIDAVFSAARARGNEGLMIKDPLSVYTPGRRGLAWLKLKKALATLDCVVVGAEYGHGKRSKVLSDYTFAVRDEYTGELKVIGKAYSGLTDAEIEELTSHFLRTARRQHGRYFEVPPDTVLEIAFDRLQPSKRHNSGLAMRFPRIVRIRADKSPSEIDTLATARRLAEVSNGKGF